MRKLFKFLFFISLSFLLLSTKTFLWAYAFDCTQGCTNLCSGKIDCLWQCYTCCPVSTIARKVDCLLCGGKWQAGHCFAKNNEQIHNQNEEREVPHEQDVGLADPAVSPVKPLSVNGPKPCVMVNFKYKVPVDIIVGFIKEDFSEIKWLNPNNCSFNSQFSWRKESRTLSCPIIYLPEKKGYIFWLISPVALETLDFEQGIYELKFYAIEAVQ